MTVNVLRQEMDDTRVEKIVSDLCASAVNTVEQKCTSSLADRRSLFAHRRSRPLEADLVTACQVELKATPANCRITETDFFNIVKATAVLATAEDLKGEGKVCVSSRPFFVF